MKRTAIYARYSSSSQSEQSIEGQLHVCNAYAQEHGLEVCYTYIDRAITGKTDDREEFQQMIKDGKAGRFEVLLVYKTDRFSRNKYDSAIYKSQLRKAGVEIRYAAEAIPEGPEGIIMESLMEGLAEYYSAELSQKIKRGIRESAMKCKSLGGNFPMGFRSNENKDIVICEEEAVIVRKIFELFCQGVKTAEICRRLNEMGYTTTRGKPFNQNSITRMIRNEKYIGTYKQGPFRKENGIPAIIDRHTFAMAQKEADRRNNNRSRQGKRADYMLSGKLFCGHCQSQMVGITGTSRNGVVHTYYQCKNQRAHQGCKKKQVIKAALEQSVVAATLNYVLRPEVIRYIGQRCEDLQRQDTRRNDELMALEKRLKECQDAQENILRAIEGGVVTRSLPERLQKLENEQVALESEIKFQTSLKDPIITAEQIEYMLTRFADPLPEEDVTQWHRRMIEAFVAKVWLYDDKLSIYYNLMGNGDELQKNDMEIAADGNKLSVRFVSGMVEATGVEPVSENVSVETSPSAVASFHSLSCA